MREVGWTDASLDGLAAIDRGIARRVKQAGERFSETGAGHHGPQHVLGGMYATGDGQVGLHPAP